MADTNKTPATETLTALRRAGARVVPERTQGTWKSGEFVAYPTGTVNVRLEIAGNYAAVVLTPDELAATTAEEIIAGLRVKIAPRAKATRAAIRRERSVT